MSVRGSRIDGVGERLTLGDPLRGVSVIGVVSYPAMQGMVPPRQRCNQDRFVRCPR